MIDLPEIKPEYEEPAIQHQTRAEDLFGKLKSGQITNLFPTVSTPPTNAQKPKSFLDQFVFYNNGTGTVRLYYFDSIQNGWDYITISGQV